MRQQKKHIFIVLLCLMSLMALCLSLVACGGNKMYSVTIADYDETQGTVAISPASEDGKYKEGTEITVTVTPNEGYALDTFKLSTDDRASTPNNEGKFVFEVKEDTTIAVTFKSTTPEPVADKFTLTVPANVDNGTVKVEPASADNKYDDGTEITVTLTPAQGYEVATFTVGGVDKKAELKDGVYKFNITADTAIAATFKAQQFTVTTTVTGESEQGSIALSPEPTEGKYAYGTRVTVTVTAKSGYGITPNSFKVSTDPDAELVDGEYTFTVTADTTISVAIHQHEYSKYEVVDGTPTEHEAYCDVCDYHLRENHSQYYIVSEKTAEGETITCSKGCGYTRSGQHNLQWVNDGDGNCHQECTNLYPKCDYKTESKLHDMKWQRLDPVSEGHSGVCNNCGYSVDKEAHDTLGEGGACSKCGYKDAGEHACIEHLAADANGFYDGECQICHQNAIFEINAQGEITKFKDYSSLKTPSGELKIKVPATVNGVSVTGFTKGTTSTGVFAKNTEITDVVIAENEQMSTLQQYLFASCTSLKSVVVLASVQSTGGMVCYGCSALEYVVLPNSIKSVGTRFFGASPARTLTKVYFMGSAEEWGSISANMNCGSATVLYSGQWSWTDATKDVPKEG